MCNTGSFGRNCVLNQRRFSELLSLRQTLCSNIYRAIAIQDVTVDVIRSRAESISNALIDIDQISDIAVRNCTAALVDTVVAYPAMSCDESTAGIVTAALSNVLQKGTSLPSDLLEQVNAASSALARGCEENIALGETPLQVVTENFRMVSSLVDSNDAAGYHLTAAQDPFETLVGDVRPSLTLGSDAFGGNAADGPSSIGLSLVQFTNNPRGEVINSSSISIRTSEYEEVETVTTRRRLSTGDASRRLAIPDAAPFSLTLELPNISPIDYFERENSTIVVYCEEKGDEKYYVNATCPGIGGLELKIECPAPSRGFFNVTCPGRKAVPRCTTWNGAMYEINSECEVVSYDAYSTTCFCRGEDTRRRFLQSSSASGSDQEFSSTFILVDEAYSELFVKYPDLLQVQRNAVIFSTLLVVVGVFFVGLIAIGFWDKNELLEIDKLKGKKTHTVRTIQGFFNGIIPDEFRPGPWKELLVKRMMLEHSWWCVFGPYHEKKGFRMAKWTLAMGKLLTYLLITTIVASVIFADNGYCERFEVRDECVEESSFAGILHSCDWNTENKSCVFKRPNVQFDTVLLFVIVVAAISAPLSHLIDILLKRLFRIIRARSATASGVVIPDVNIEEHKEDLREYWHLNDELRDVQTLRTKFLKASRLRKMQASADFALPTAETETLMLLADDHLGDYGRRELTTSRENFSTMESSQTVRHNRYAAYASSKGELLRSVQLARKRADFIRTEMEYMITDDQREEYLIKQFVVDAFHGHQRNIASRYFLGSIQSTKRSRLGKVLRYLSLLLLPAIFGVLIYFVIFFNLDIGSRATDLWLFVAFITLLEDIFFLQPLKIWLTWVVINSYVSAEAFKICVALKLRFNWIMNRRYGAMRDANSLIQHFNPACRAARLFPHLPVSRFLMSVNDYDIPKFTVDPTHYGYPEPIATLMRVSTAVVAFLTQLPFSIQDSVVDVLGTVVINLVAISFYLLGTMVLGLAIALVVVLAIAFWLRETNYLSKLRKKKTTLDFKKFIPPPRSNKVVPVDVVSKISDDFDRKVLFKSQFKALDEHEALHLSANTPRQIEEADRMPGALYPSSSSSLMKSTADSVVSRSKFTAVTATPPLAYLPNESMASSLVSRTSKSAGSLDRSTVLPRGASLTSLPARPLATESSMQPPTMMSHSKSMKSIGDDSSVPGPVQARSVMAPLSLRELHEMEMGTDEDVEKAELKALRRAAKKNKKRVTRKHQPGLGAHAEGEPSPKPSEEDNFSMASETTEQREARRRYKRRKDKFGHKESDTGGPGISSARKLYSSSEFSGEEKGAVGTVDNAFSVMSAGAPGAVAGRSSMMHASKTSQFPTWH